VDPDRILAMAKRVKQRLRCSQQRAEYIASLLAWERTVSADSFELLADIQAIHSLRHHSGYAKEPIVGGLI
jgi:hypothetical protein